MVLVMDIVFHFRYKLKLKKSHMVHLNIKYRLVILKDELSKTWRNDGWGVVLVLAMERVIKTE